MFDVNPRLLFLIGFLGAIAVYVLWDKKLERHSFLFIRRTKKGILTIDRIAKRLPRFWNYYGWTGVFTGLVSVFAALAALLYTFYQMIVTRSAESGPSLILPGAVSQTKLQAGVTFVPAEYWVISILIMMTVHELSHGIVARAEGIELRSVGWAILGILPLGAFVEPEGERMLPDSGEKNDSGATWDVGSWKSRLKVLCAGSFANYLTAGLFFLLATGMTAALTSPTFYYNAQEGYPAYDAGMRNGTLIAVDGKKVDNVKDLRNMTESIKVNETVSLWTSEGNFTVTATHKKGDEKGYIGLLLGQTATVEKKYKKYQAGINWFLSLLMTVSFLNFLIGLFNMAPIKPLDGGLVSETITSEFLGEERIRDVNRFSILMWAGLIAALLMGIASTFIF